MADSHAKNHDYHLVDPSPWPIVGSIGALILAIGVHLLDARRPDLECLAGALLGFAIVFLHHVHVVARCCERKATKVITPRSCSFTCAMAC